MIVVKFGGHAMKDENGNFAKAISAALATGEKVVVVHGGGPQIDAALKAKQISSDWIGGFRVTTQEIFDVVEEVLVNQVGCYGINLGRIDFYFDKDKAHTNQGTTIVV